MRSNSKGMGGHQSAKSQTDVWLTPPEIIHALGEFDLDPASPIDRPWDTAKHHYTILDDGLKQPWFGRVWLNPPYGDLAWPFMERLGDHDDGIAPEKTGLNRNWKEKVRQQLQYHFERIEKGVYANQEKVKYFN